LALEAENVILTLGYAYDGQLGHNSPPNRLVLMLLAGKSCVSLSV
jgi:hypothetical protein